MTTTKDIKQGAPKPDSLTSTRFGSLSRDIEKSIGEAASGERGATGEAIRLARRREELLNSRWIFSKKSA